MVQLLIAVCTEMTALQAEVSRHQLGHTKLMIQYPAVLQCILQTGAEVGIALHSRDSLDLRRTSVADFQAYTQSLLWQQLPTCSWLFLALAVWHDCQQWAHAHLPACKSAGIVCSKCRISSVTETSCASNMPSRTNGPLPSGKMTPSPVLRRSQGAPRSCTDDCRPIIRCFSSTQQADGGDWFLPAKLPAEG